MIIFGPVPSRRLGRSLGINNIPAKHCSYTCVYCQLGATASREGEPRAYYSPAWIRDKVAEKLRAAEAAGVAVDYLTFVPDGEPTLDRNLGEAIRLLRPLGRPVAVISNASQTWRPEVREALKEADWLSLKVDSVDEPLWRRINRPHPDLRLEAILDGVRTLAREFTGTLTTESMLVHGVNDQPETLASLAAFLGDVAPQIAYLAVPIRPTALPGIVAPDAEALTAAYHLFRERLPRVEYLTAEEGDAFAATGDVVEDLLSISAVHPMREDAVRAMLARGGREWRVVVELIAAGRLRETRYQGQRFYLRVFS